jgi:hypothetical protein
VRHRSAQRVHQTDGSGAHQLIEVGVSRQSSSELPRDVMNEVEMLGEQGVASG